MDMAGLGQALSPPLLCFSCLCFSGQHSSQKAPSKDVSCEMSRAEDSRGHIALSLYYQDGSLLGPAGSIGLAHFRS